MKKHLILTITLLVCKLSFAQLWDSVNINTSHTLAGIDFITPDTGVAVGYSSSNVGGLWRTTDGGTTWNSITIPSGTDRLLNVYFADALTGYAIGDSGVVLKTIDAGATWNPATDATDSQLKGIFFFDANRGYVGGSDGVVLKTTDGGLSWTVFNDTVTGTTQQVRSIYFTNDTTGYITGDGGMIKKTTDGGNTWTTHANPFLGFFNGRSIWFTDAGTGYIAAMGGKIIKTTDAGATWFSVNVGSSNNLSVIVFTNSNTGYVAGENGTILKSTDAGANWLPADSNITTQNLIAMSFVNNNIGYISGVDGIVLKTINGATPVSEVTDQLTYVNAYPNPFNETTTIKYLIRESSNVSLALYDVSGRRLFSSTHPEQAGEHFFELDAERMNLGKGIYFLHLSTGKGNKVLKLVVN